MPHGVVTQLMFERTAGAAMTLYVSPCNGSVIAVQKYGPGGHGKEGSIKRAELTVGSHRLACIDSSTHHQFTFTPSASLFVECADAEFDRAFTTLADAGSVLIPPGDSGFSRKFAWVNDRFVVS